jgi:hypothetical protein
VGKFKCPECGGGQFGVELDDSIARRNEYFCSKAECGWKGRDIECGNPDDFCVELRNQRTFVIRLSDNNWLSSDGSRVDKPDHAKVFTYMEEAISESQERVDAAFVETFYSAYKQYCPDHHRDYCTCRKRSEDEAKGRKADIAESAYESLGFVLETIGSYMYRVKNHPELIVTMYGKWKLNGKWNRGIGKLRDYISVKAGKKPRPKKKTAKLLNIANRYGDVDIRHGVPFGFVHLPEDKAAKLCVKFDVSFANAMVGFVNIEGKWKPVRQGVVLQEGSLTKIAHLLPAVQPQAST